MIMKSWFKKQHSFLYKFCAFICFLPYWPLILRLAKNPEKNYKQLVSYRKRIAKLTNRLAGIKFNIAEDPAIDWSKNYILCPNHTSNLDISAMIMACPHEFSFMGKIELLENPVTGIFFKSIDIPVDRKSKISSFKAFKKASTWLEKGKSVVIFPEGKIGDQYPPVLCEFKTGPFRLAAEKNIGIIPVVIHNAWELQWDDGSKYGSQPGTVNVQLYAPIYADNSSKEATDQLQEQTYAIIKNNWKQANKS